LIFKPNWTVRGRFVSDDTLPNVAGSLKFGFAIAAHEMPPVSLPKTTRLKALMKFARNSTFTLSLMGVRLMIEKPASQGNLVARLLVESTNHSRYHSIQLSLCDDPQLARPNSGYVTSERDLGA
jgi:hypothetical protein